MFNTSRLHEGTIFKLKTTVDKEKQATKLANATIKQQQTQAQHEFKRLEKEIEQLKDKIRRGDKSGTTTTVKAPVKPLQIITNKPISTTKQNEEVVESSEDPLCELNKVNLKLTSLVRGYKVTTADKPFDEVTSNINQQIVYIQQRLALQKDEVSELEELKQKLSTMTLEYERQESILEFAVEKGLQEACESWPEYTGRGMGTV